MPLLNYRLPEPSNTGCGSLLLQTIGGFAPSLICLQTANYVAGTFRYEPNQILTLLLCFALSLVVASYLAYLRRPGFLIGFLIASSMMGLLIAPFAERCFDNNRLLI